MGASGVEEKRSRLRLLRGGGEPSPAPNPAQAGAARAWDDSELLSALRAGDASAATPFHDRVRPAVERTIRRLLGVRDPDQDDVAQIALMEIVTSIDRYRGDCSLDSWVSMLTARVVYKSIRRRRLERGLFDPAQFDEALASRDRIMSAYPETGRHSVLQRILAHLNAMEAGRAFVFTLHDVWGYDLRETAQIMDLSVAAAQSRLVRARRELHSRVADDPALVQALHEIGVGS